MRLNLATGFKEGKNPRSAAGASASRPRRESPAEDFLTCTYHTVLRVTSMAECSVDDR
ncbi:hypothetical protein DPMN_059310 [Dreissena polymorpha]|uniref:Uncharacterized protein n=1 Tax=Dreissena polymorpha TaxID=45954 RepID=A0A9D4HH47_DREPO|nr:hypothetical protein DPMN_059310 [Dreissena polymorpha]